MAAGSVLAESVVGARQIVVWFDEGKPGKPPPLSCENAITKAADCAAQAKRLAEAKGMRGYVKKAEKLLSEINKKSQ